MKKQTVLLAAAAIMLTGCSSAAAEPASSPSPTAKPTATTSQFASIIAEHQKTWRDYESNITACALAAVVGTTVADTIKAQTCAMTAQTVTLEAKTANRDILALPSPPSEVRDLVDRTVAALGELSNSFAPNSCSDYKSETCDDAITKANGDIRPLISILDAWSPYTK